MPKILSLVKADHIDPFTTIKATLGKKNSKDYDRFLLLILEMYMYSTANADCVFPALPPRDGAIAVNLR